MPDMPDKLFFQYNQFALMKEFGLVLIFKYPIWDDAQISPPPEWDKSPKVSKAETADLLEVLEILGSMQFEKYANLTYADFKITPPDQSHTELLKIIWEDKIVIDWSVQYRRLKPELADPLEKICDLIRSIGKPI